LDKLVDIIKRVQGVISAVVDLSEDGELREVHVVADVSRPVKAIVRDIESVLVTYLGRAVDHRKIGVAQIQGRPAGASETRAFRLRIHSLSTTMMENVLMVKVRLSANDRVFEGEACGSSLSGNRLRLAARAGLQVVGKFLNGGCSFQLEDLVQFTIGRQEALLASVSLESPAGHELLCGCCLAGEDPMISALRACLNAVNRRVLFLMDD